jgi:hypothetical protein
MAITYDVTPANGGANAVTTLESTGALAMYKITVRSTSNGANTAVTLSGVDGAYGSVYDQILREIQPHLAYADAGAGGTMHIVVDSHSRTADTIAAAIEAIDGAGTDTIVQAAASFAVTP